MDVETEKSKQPRITEHNTDHTTVGLCFRSLFNTDGMWAWEHSHKVNNSTYYRTLHAGHLYFGVCSRQTQHNCIFVIIAMERRLFLVLILLLPLRLLLSLLLLPNAAKSLYCHLTVASETSRHLIRSRQPFRHSERLRHMKGYKFAPLSWNNKLSGLCIMINDSHLCEDTYQVHYDLTRLDKIGI